LPEVALYILANYGVDRFTGVFVGNFDTISHLGFRNAKASNRDDSVTPWQISETVVAKYNDKV
jgi:hypothetical protein